MKNRISSKGKYQTSAGEIHFTVNHSGKMEGMQSISTSCTNNNFCQAMQQAQALEKFLPDGEKIVCDCVCTHCYAQAQQEYRTTCAVAYQKNGELLESEVIPVEEWPELESDVFRLESFRDLRNVTHVENYMNFIKRNPGAMFAWWSKRMGLIREWIQQGHDVPENVIFVESSAYMNICKDQHTLAGIVPENQLKTFTVYSKEYAKAAGIEINCGARKCAGCLRCYRKDTEKQIRELVK